MLYNVDMWSFRQKPYLLLRIFQVFTRLQQIQFREMYFRQKNDVFFMLCNSCSRSFRRKRHLLLMLGPENRF